MRLGHENYRENGLKLFSLETEARHFWWNQASSQSKSLCEGTWRTPQPPCMVRPCAWFHSPPPDFLHKWQSLIEWEPLLLAMCKIQRYIQILSASRNYVKLLGLSPSLRTLRVIASASLGSSFQYISIVSIFRSIAKLLSCYHLYSFFHELRRTTATYDANVSL